MTPAHPALRRTAALGHLLLGAVALAGCQQPGPAPVRRQLRPPQATAEPLACRGGLLCEDPQTLAGFRVPLGCHRTYDGRYTKICVVSGIRPARALEEFLTSRYAAAVDGESWLVQQPDLGQLRVFLRGEVAEFVAMPVDPTPAAPAPAAR